MNPLLSESSLVNSSLHKEFHDHDKKHVKDDVGDEEDGDGDVDDGDGDKKDDDGDEEADDVKNVDDEER